MKRVDLRIGGWRNAVDGERVDSVGVGFLTPLGDRTDIEFHLELDHSESFGRATILSVFLYFFGVS